MTEIELRNLLNTGVTLEIGVIDLLGNKYPMHNVSARGVSSSTSLDSWGGDINTHSIAKLLSQHSWFYTEITGVLPFGGVALLDIEFNERFGRSFAEHVRAEKIDVVNLYEQLAEMVAGKLLHYHSVDFCLDSLKSAPPAAIAISKKNAIALLAILQVDSRAAPSKPAVARTKARK